LSTIREVRGFLARAGRDLERENLENLKPADRIAVVRAKTYLASTLGSLIQATEMEARLAELERLIVTGGM